MQYGTSEALEDGSANGMDPGVVKVLIADDHPLLITGIRRTLEASENIEVVGEAYSGPQVMALIERRKPNLVLLDLRMPGVTENDCIERIRDEWPEVKTVVLSACADRESIEGALEAGASAYVVKTVASVDIAGVIRQAASGAVYHATGRARTAPSMEPEVRVPILTARERVILEAVGQGMTTAAISKDLWVTEQTVKFHLTNIYRKLGVANRAAAVRYAAEHGMLAAV